MAHLCALKRTAEMTKTQLRAWYAMLGMFPNWIVNRAVIEMAASETRFPEIGDVFRLCRREAISRGLILIPYSPNGDGKDETKLMRSEIDAMGDAMGLDIRPQAR